MNKQELTIVVLLFALLLGWGITSSKQRANQAAMRPAATNAVDVAGADLAGADVEASPAPAASVEGPAAGAVEAVGLYAAPETTVSLTNGLLRVVVSSHGAAISEAELFSFRATVDQSSSPVQLHFENQPALALRGLGTNDAFGDFTLESDPAVGRIVARARNAAGIELERTIRLIGDYRLDVRDVFRNASAEPAVLPTHGMGVGPMRMGQGESQIQGMAFLGVDTLATDDKKGVEHWGKKVNEVLGVKSTFGCARPNLSTTPVAAHQDLGKPTDWVAAKNKFFVQILTPEQEPAQDCRILVTRDAAKSSLTIDTVAGELRFAGRRLEPGQAWTRTAAYYVGPKEYSSLKALGQRKTEIMQFGWYDWFRAICAGLLHTLNAFHRVIPNYGIAVILVTVLVRMIFWPVTQKSAQSMKKMQKIQPLVTALREKHKSNPQKLNQEMMLLYKEHKVNPLSGCLPMLVQIPVFIALFNVLRSAIELRYAEFLWIHDLSEPENLLRGLLPFGLSLNILPLLMTATTIWQQKMTPSMGDPQQQKIMTWMPIIFLFFFYTMPSALVLYWTVSQLISILQMKINNRKGAPDLPSAPVLVTNPKKKRLRA